MKPQQISINTSGDRLIIVQAESCTIISLHIQTTCMYPIFRGDRLLVSHDSSVK